MIYMWLKHLQIMHIYETHEDFQNQISWHTDQTVVDNIRNQHGFTVMIEENTKYWDD